MQKILLAGAAIAALLAGPAMAADLPVRAPVTKAPPPAVPLYNWTGFYIGGHAGFGWAETDYDFNSAGFWNNAPGDSFTQDSDGFLGGGHLGFNYQIGQFVWGLEGSYTWSDVKGSDASPFVFGDSFDTKARWLATITPRLGIANNNWLFYVKGGVAFSEIRSRISGDGFESSEKDTRTGWTVGGGVEWGITPNWVLGVEGNYYDFGSFNVNRVTDLTTGLSTPDTNHDVDTRMWSVLGRLSYKFDFGGPLVARY